MHCVPRCACALVLVWDCRWARYSLCSILYFVKQRITNVYLLRVNQRLHMTAGIKIERIKIRDFGCKATGMPVSIQRPDSVATKFVPRIRRPTCISLTLLHSPVALDVDCSEYDADNEPSKLNAHKTDVPEHQAVKDPFQYSDVEYVRPC
jgi:hypothetical protein